jgi:hypothetical protein
MRKENASTRKGSLCTRDLGVSTREENLRTCLFGGSAYPSGGPGLLPGVGATSGGGEGAPALDDLSSDEDTGHPTASPAPGMPGAPGTRVRKRSGFPGLSVQRGH